MGSFRSSRSRYRQTIETSHSGIGTTSGPELVNADSVTTPPDEIKKGAERPFCVEAGLLEELIELLSLCATF